MKQLNKISYQASGAFILGLLTLLLLASFTAPKTNPTCSEALEKVLEWHHKAFMEDKTYHTVFELKAIYNGQQLSPVRTEVWRKGYRLRVLRDEMEVISDGTQNVIIMHGSKKIIVRSQHIDAAAQPTVETPAVVIQQLDTLISSANKIECDIQNGMGTLMLWFPANSTSPLKAVKQAIFNYNSETGRLMRSHFVYRENKQKLEHQTLNYIEYSADSQNGGFQGNAVNQVFDNQKLKTRYADFDVTDLRKR